MGSTAITGELVWPSQNDVYGSGVSGAVGDGKKHLEVQRRKVLGSSAGRNNYMISGGTLPATDVNLVIDVAAGAAIIEGHYCQWPTTSITLPDTNTSYIYIKLIFSANLVTGLEIEDNTSGTPPTASLQLGTAVTSGGATTSTTDTRILGPGFVEVLTSGTSYQVPAGIYRLKARVFGSSGGGGGGGASANTGGPADGGDGGNGTAGGSTTFDTLTANGGGAGPGGPGGGNNSARSSVAHSTATGGAVNLSGMGLPGGLPGGGNHDHAPSGGDGCSGGNGGFCEIWMNVTPGATIAYAIGAAGTAGAAGASSGGDSLAGTAGQDGLAGRIELEY